MNIRVRLPIVPHPTPHQSQTNRTFVSKDNTITVYHDVIACVYVVRRKYC